MYIMDSPAELTLVGDGGACGSLKVNLIPTDSEGIKNLGEEMDESDDTFEDPKELLGKRFDFKVIIESGKLPDNFCKNVYCEYKILMHDQF